MAQAYAEKLKLAQNVEKISEAWVDTAITVHARLLSLRTCSDLLDWMDRAYLTNSPFKYINTFQAIVDRGQTAAGITLGVVGLVDGWRMGALGASAFAVAKLKDYRTSYIEVIKMKEAMALVLACPPKDVAMEEHGHQQQAERPLPGELQASCLQHGP